MSNYFYCPSCGNPFKKFDEGSKNCENCKGQLFVTAGFLMPPIDFAQKAKKMTKNELIIENEHLKYEIRRLQNNHELTLRVIVDN